MKLLIDTSQNAKIRIAIKRDNEIIVDKEFESRFSQSEKLLKAISLVFEKSDMDLNSVEEIQVENSGSSFTALRIGVVTANALSFALKIPITNFKGENLKKEGVVLVKPEYDREPDITVSKT